jgi:hypothetical protein
MAIIHLYVRRALLWGSIGIGELRALFDVVALLEHMPLLGSLVNRHAPKAPRIELAILVREAASVAKSR